MTLAFVSRLKWVIDPSSLSGLPPELVRLHAFVAAEPHGPAGRNTDSTVAMLIYESFLDPLQFEAHPACSSAPLYRPTNPNLVLPPPWIASKIAHIFHRCIEENTGLNLKNL
jgi:hypothetical protein